MMDNCRCSNKNVKSNFKFCPYCGQKFVAAKKRYPFENYFSFPTGSYAISTGEKRPPRKGEYYLSGARPTAYLAPNDLSTSYIIAEVVVDSTPRLR